MIRLQQLVKLLVVVGVMTILSHCGKNNTAPAPGTFASVYSSIATSNCVRCHKPGGSAVSDAGVDLDFSTSATSYTGLKNGLQKSTMTQSCNGVKLVDTTSATSYFMGILFQQYSTGDFGKSGCTSAYNAHYQYANLTADEQSSFEKWIAAGAPNN